MPSRVTKYQSEAWRRRKQEAQQEEQRRKEIKEQQLAQQRQRNLFEYNRRQMWLAAVERGPLPSQAEVVFDHFASPIRWW